MKLKLLIMFIMTSTAICAQDVIVKKDGSTILSKVLEIESTNIKYKKFSNLNGPVYNINKSEVFSINYENGEKDVFNTESSIQNTTSDEPTFVNAKVSENNKQEIQKYNQDNHYIKDVLKFSKKELKRYHEALYFINLTDSSILENSDIKITLEKDDYPFSIYFHNKTSKNIYVDLGSSFCIYPDERYVTFFRNTSTTNYDLSSSSKGSNIGAGIGLGGVANILGLGGALKDLAGSTGVNAGLNRSNSTVEGSTTTSFAERIVVIPPHSKARIKSFLDCVESFSRRYVDRYIDRNYPDLKYIIPHYIRKNDFNMNDYKYENGEEIIYNYNNTPSKRKYLFTYTTDPNFKLFSNISFETFVAKIIKVHGYYGNSDYKKAIENYDNSTLLEAVYFEKE